MRFLRKPQTWPKFENQDCHNFLRRGPISKQNTLIKSYEKSYLLLLLSGQPAAP